MQKEQIVPANFIKQIIKEDIRNKKYAKIIMRFPPEPNGYLHIGHAKAIFLNYQLAKEFNGMFHLRFDDTNPETEEKLYIDSIKEDILWLGANWNDKLFYSSDYFERLYQYAIDLIKKNKAFVCQLSPEEIKEFRGTLETPGKESPYRDRNIDENLKLFKEMREGKYNSGEYCLRAKIDMNSPNINMRDPVIYRIKKRKHIKTQYKWPIYPMYDFSHPLSDSIESITHSLCTLEFEDHRPLYDWFLKELNIHHPQQIEFARLNLEYTVMSKRMLKQLVDQKYVDGWDDPRMPTISGMRNRGYPAQAITKFCNNIGVTKKNSTIAMETLEATIREELNQSTHRLFCVINPIKIVIENWPENEIKKIIVKNHPFNKEYGQREVIFSKNIYIEKDDFCEEPNKKFFRLKPNGQVRLKYAYVITCNKIIKDDNGNILEIRCTYNKDTFAGATPKDMKKVKGIIHWVSTEHCVSVNLNLYDRLFKVKNPLEDKDFIKNINENSLTKASAKIELGIKQTSAIKFQFERLGYFLLDKNNKNKFIFNRIVTLKDTWDKVKNNI